MRLTDLQRTATQLETELAVLKNKLVALNTPRAAYGKQLRAYQADRVRQIETRQLVLRSRSSGRSLCYCYPGLASS